jgi:hypothetical protein
VSRVCVACGDAVDAFPAWRGPGSGWHESRAVQYKGAGRGPWRRIWKRKKKEQGNPVAR